MAKPTLTLEERFWSKVDKRGPDECWLWMASLNSSGYGQIGAQGSRADRAHRVSYRLNVGPIPHQMCVLHRCDNRPCVNPAHLFLGTRQDNNADKVAKNRQSRSGGPKPGEAYNSRLTSENVESILLDRRTHEEIASDYGITRSSVGCIKRGRSWAHVRPDIAREQRCLLVPDDVQEEARKLRASGRSYSEIGRALGIALSSAHRYCRSR